MLSRIDLELSNASSSKILAEHTAFSIAVKWSSAGIAGFELSSFVDLKYY